MDVQCHLFMKDSQILQGRLFGLGNIQEPSSNIQEPTKTTMTVLQTPSWQRGPARGSYGNASKEDSDWQMMGVEKQSKSISILVTSWPFNCNISMACVLAIEDPILSTTESIAFTESVLK